MSICPRSPEHARARFALPMRLRSPVLLCISVGLVACAGFAGCARSPSLALQSISGAMPNLEFRLTDDNGRPVTAQSYRGDVVLLYFGYTHCPDACPTTLAVLSQAIKRLGEKASRVRVLFVSVDPRRDTGSLLKRYAGFFGPEFIGLRGDDEQLASVTRRYHASFRLDPPERDGDYTVQHSNSVYIFDPSGRARLVTDAADKPSLITHDLRALIGGA